MKQVKDYINTPQALKNTQELQFITVDEPFRGVCEAEQKQSPNYLQNIYISSKYCELFLSALF